MNKAFIEKGTLEKLYLEEKMPMYKISEVLGVSVGSVYNYMKKYSIESRKDNFTFKGKRHTDSAKQKVAESRKGKKMSNESKQRLSDAKKMGFDSIDNCGHKKLRADGYIYLYVPSHKKATKDGYVMEHILIAERYFRVEIGKDEVVHHINHKRDDNRPENLMIMKRKKHMGFHTKLRHVERRLLNEYQ